MKITSIVFILVLFASNVFGQYPPDAVWNPVTPPILAQPGYLQTVHDSIDNIDITCISDAVAFGVPAGAGELFPPYAKIQAWNSDMTKICIGFTNILNANDYTIYKNITNAYSEGFFNDGRWSNVNPDIRYFCYGDRFMRINIETEVVDTLHTFAGYTAGIGPWEGNISANDKYAVITDVGAKKATLYDIELDVVVSNKTFAGSGFDWATITPWNDYIAVSNNNTGRVELYDLNFNYLRDLSDNQQHADFAISTAGDKVLVQVIPLSMTRLDNGQNIDLISSALVCGNFTFNPSIAGHISGRNLNLPGWALVSTQTSDTCTNGLGYYYRTEMFAIKLDASGTIRKFGYSHTSCTSYDTHAVATFSPDGTKAIFTSDWSLSANNNLTSLAYVAEFNANPLSVSLTSIDVKHQSGTNIINWRTENEVSFDHFIIERYFDSNGFSAIGEVASKGFEVSNYTFEDENIRGGNYLYRLKMVDLDGEYQYSKIISVIVDSKDKYIHIYPNPASRIAKIEMPHISGQKHIKVTDIRGSEILSATTKDSKYSIDTYELPQGIYWLIVKTEKNIFTHKLLVSHF